MKINKSQIKFLIKKQTLKQKDVAQRLGVPQQDFNNWMFRGIFPYYNKLEELAEILETEVNSLLENNDLVEESAGQILSSKKIPYFERNGQYEFNEIWQNSSSLKPTDYYSLPKIKANFIIPYYGKDMAPQIENGDLIALKKIEDLSFMNFGTLNAVITEEQVIIREIRKSEKKDTIKLVSHSKQVDPVEIPIKSIRGVFAVVATIKQNLI